MATVRALVDTGATSTCISKNVAREVEFEPVGKVQVHGVGGLVSHNSYLFHIAFPFQMAGQLSPNLPPPNAGQVQASLHVLEKLIQGFEFDNASAGFDVLLGMDVIATGSLVVQGNGTFSFSF
jgi:hypothetical protein